MISRLRVMAVVLVTLLTACGLPQPGPTDSSPNDVLFALEPSAEFVQDPELVTLTGTMAIGYSQSGYSAYDVEADEIAWFANFDQGYGHDYVLTAPPVINSAGTIAYFTMPVLEQEAGGTVLGLSAVNVADGSRAGNLDIELGEIDFIDDELPLEIRALNNDLVVLTLVDSYLNYTAVVDLGQLSVLWTGMISPLAVTSETLLGWYYQDNGATLSALDLETGELRWKDTETSDGITILPVGGERLFLSRERTGGTDTGPEIIDAITGESLEPVADFTPSSSFLADDLVISFGGDKLWAVSADTFEPVWEREESFDSSQPPLLRDGLIYANLRDGNLVVIDAATGETLVNRMIGNIVDANDEGVLVREFGPSTYLLKFFPRQ